MSGQFSTVALAVAGGGVKYLILSALAAFFLVFGIALIFGTAIRRILSGWPRGFRAGRQQALLVGVLLVLFGLSFKIAAFPLQVWAPDVYQGAPTPVTAFLAIGSKAAGFVLLLRVLFMAVRGAGRALGQNAHAGRGRDDSYGNLCAIRNAI